VEVAEKSNKLMQPRLKKLMQWNFVLERMYWNCGWD
jgi:hypothetical protein